MSDREVVASFRFRVRLAEIGPRGGARRSRELDVHQVVLPVFRGRPSIDTAEIQRPVGSDERLTLRRGHTGDAYLYDWWRQERNPKYRGSRVIEVDVLDAVGKPVTAWRFTRCHLAEFRYSPLDALESAVLTEIAEIDVETVEQRSVRR